MTARRFFSELFKRQTWKEVAYLLLGGVCIAPVLVTTLINQQLQIPPLFFGSILLYIGVFIFGGSRFERWRAWRLLGIRTLPHHSGWRTACYAALELILGIVGIMLVLGWLIISIRNIVLYPLPGVGEWGRAYPDPSWGGPTWQGAIALHTGSALLALFIMPWVIRGMAQLQAKLAAKLL